MHTNVSISKDGKNLFWTPGEEAQQDGLGVVDRILTHGNDIASCSIPASTPIAARPHFEAPNQLKASLSIGRNVRIPIATRSMRTEVAPSLPSKSLLVMYSIFKTGLDGQTAIIKNLARRSATSDNIYTALDNFEKATGLRSSSAET